MGEIEVLIAELKLYEQSLNFNIAGYTQRLPDGKEHFCCKICGHSPALLIERLENIAQTLPKKNITKAKKD